MSSYLFITLEAPLFTMLLYSFRNSPFPFFLIFSPHSSSSSSANTYSHILFISTFPYLLSSSPYPHLAYLFLFHLLPPQIPRQSTSDVINSLRFSSVCLKVAKLKQECRFRWVFCSSNAVLKQTVD